jgi:predicted double-glycine peptidase
VPVLANAWRRCVRATSLVALLLAVACAGQRSSARSVDEVQLATEPGWQRVSFSGVRQTHDKDCGAAALSSVLHFWGHKDSARQIDERLRRSSDLGLRAGDLRDYARSRALSAYVFFGTLSDLRHELGQGRPVIVGVVQPRSEAELLSHYEVVIGHNAQRRSILTWDPARGLREDSEHEFARQWASSKGVTLVIFDPERPSQ